MKLPLLSHTVADSLLIPDSNDGHGPITRGRFVAQAQALAAKLPTADYAINLCQNRYYFLLGFAAACLREQTNLLPANQASGALESLTQSYPSSHTIDDATIRTRLNEINIPDNRSDIAWPAIDQHHLAAIAFTSGSTGKPQAHRCTWGMLVGAAKRSAQQLFTQRGLHIVATVPPQHMFGLETTILQPLVNDCAIHSGRPFFPAEIFDALNALPAPRALITTPAHLKTCFGASTGAPRIEFVLSATAPLSAALATSVEDSWHTQVLEIYGSTETGAIATRRTSQGDTWNLMAGGELIDTVDGIEYRVATLPPVKLHDTLVRRDATHFELRARSQDLIKVAGKRASLTELNARLLAIPGVIDGIIFQPQPDARVAALVVVKDIQARDIQAALAEHIDAVFLPRPLRLVSSLPRDAVGKLPREQLLAALTQT